MATIEFTFSEIDEEIDALSKVAAGFIAKRSSRVLGDLRTMLNGIRSAPAGRSHFWNIPEGGPLCTEPSWGDYEPGSEGQHNVFASVTSTWQIEPLGQHNPGSRPHRKFTLVGIASTRIRIIKGTPDEPQEELAMWRMEVGDDASPGCHFHVQVLGEQDVPPFPHSLSIPRLPGLAITPMAAFEFVVGELFQDKWREHAGNETNDMKRWQPIQRRRLIRLLQWQKAAVENASGSPWTALKIAKPEADLFSRSD